MSVGARFLGAVFHFLKPLVHTCHISCCLWVALPSAVLLKLRCKRHFSIRGINPLWWQMGAVMGGKHKHWSKQTFYCEQGQEAIFGLCLCECRSGETGAGWYGGTYGPVEHQLSGDTVRRQNSTSDWLRSVGDVCHNTGHRGRRRGQDERKSQGGKRKPTEKEKGQINQISQYFRSSSDYPHTHSRGLFLSNIH